MSDDDYDDIDLATLPDDELVKQMHDDLYDGLADEIVEGTTILLDRGWGADKVLNDALVEGMRIVGIDFRDGILFVPEVLLAANAMKAGMGLLRPLLAETGAEPIGKIVIGTVKGDIHDIGKNLTAMMMEGAGFEVVDLGINCDVDKYLAALEEHQPDILGMSALLTTTMPYMKVVIDTLTEKQLRDKYIVLVGGAPLNEEFGAAIGADAYCRDAAVAAETAKELVGARRAARSQPDRRQSPEHPAEPVGGHEHGRSRLRARRRPVPCDPGVRCARPRAACRARPGGHRRRGRGRLPAGTAPQPSRADRARRSRPAWPTSIPSRPVFLGYADCGTGGMLDAFIERSERRDHAAARRPLLRVLRRCRALRRAARRGARHVLPHRLPGQALRRADLAGARPRPPPGAARHVLRQLPTGRAAVTDRRSGSRRGRPGRRRAARPRVRARADRARAVRPPDRVSLSEAIARTVVS